MTEANIGQGWTEKDAQAWVLMVQALKHYARSEGYEIDANNISLVGVRKIT